MASSWNQIREGEERKFGFLQLDIVGSSQLAGPEHAKQQTKTQLRTLVDALLEAYSAKRLHWGGDGGSYLFLISAPQKDYDNMVAAALHVLEMMPFFNSAKDIHSFIDQDINLRISCHAGMAHYTRKHQDLHGQHIDYFLKYERELSHQGSVTITQAVYDQMTSRRVKGLFQPAGWHEMIGVTGPVKTALFRSFGLQEGILLDRSIVELRSSEARLRSYRTLLHHYHLTQLRGCRLWRYWKYDFGAGPNGAGRLTASVVASDRHNHPHKYEIAAGLIDERFFIFVKNPASYEPTIIEVYPHMGILGFGVHAGVGFMQTWDGPHFVTRCMFSPAPLLDIKEEGDVPERLGSDLDKLWSDTMSRQGDLLTLVTN